MLIRQAKTLFMSSKSSLFLWSLIAALAGFLFGFDTVVISGAEKALQELWPRGEVFHGWVIMWWFGCRRIHDSSTYFYIRNSSGKR